MTREEMLERLKKGEDPLELSIQKWQDIVDGKGRDFGYDNCALCEVYRISFVCLSCSRCIIGTNCSYTPYFKYRDALASSNKRKQQKCAEKELEFLKSLRRKDGY